MVDLRIYGHQRLAHDGTIRDGRKSRFDATIRESPKSPAYARVKYHIERE